MWGMIATSHIENGAIAQMRITPSEKSSPEVVCVVDDDPMMLRAMGRLLASDGFAVRPLIKARISLPMLRHTTCRSSYSIFG
jgi:hypothetical protein